MLRSNALGAPGAATTMNSPPTKGDAAGSATSTRRRDVSTASEREGYHQAGFRVTYAKQSGVTRIYGVYDRRAEAERVCNLLRWAGAVANVEVAP